MVKLWLGHELHHKSVRNHSSVASSLRRTCQYVKCCWLLQYALEKQLTTPWALQEACCCPSLNTDYYQIGNERRSTRNADQRTLLWTAALNFLWEAMNGILFIRTLSRILWRYSFNGMNWNGRCQWHTAMTGGSLNQKLFKERGRQAYENYCL